MEILHLKKHLATLLYKSDFLSSLENKITFLFHKISTGHGTSYWFLQQFSVTVAISV